MESAQADAVLLDMMQFAEWLDECGLAPGPIEGFARLGGGTQNLMYSFKRAGTRYVLRRGPRNLRLSSNTLMQREARVLTALEHTDVPVARLVAFAEAPRLGPASHHLTTWVDGFNPALDLPSPHAKSAPIRKQMILQLVNALGILGQLDVGALGLSSVGQPDDYLARQVPRWLAELDKHRATAGYPVNALPGVDELATWLEENRPAMGTAGLLHGDCHVGNVLYRYDGATIAAIVDWENCTIGDPMLDLGLLVATLPDQGEPTLLTGRLGSAGGLPEAAELASCYAERTRRDTSALGWYVALAGFKVGIICEGTYARACGGLVPMARGEFLHGVALELLQRAQRAARC